MASNVFMVNLFGRFVVDFFIISDIYSDLFEFVFDWRSVADIDKDESILMINLGQVWLDGIYIFSGMMIDNNIYIYLFAFRMIFLL